MCVSICTYWSEEMAGVEERNHQALMAIFDKFKADGILEREHYRLHTEKYNNDNREYDARLMVSCDALVYVRCVNGWFEVHISPPQSIGFLFEDEFKPRLLKENRKDHLFESYQMKLSDGVIIRNGRLAPNDKIFLNFSGNNNRLEVHLNGDTCVPRLKLLLERICRGR